MGKLEEAVLLTKKYATFFHGRLSDGELHRWLISDKIYSPLTINRLFPQKTDISPPRSEVKKLTLARKVAKLLSFLPTISLVAITGSLAINNSKPRDDIDLMVVTRSDTLWLTRLIAISMISLFFKRRRPVSHPRGIKSEIKDSICTNLWLDESALAVPCNKRNLYTAHEVLQALPIFDRGGVYQRFIRANSWTKKYLANAYQIAKDESGGGVTRNGAQILWQRAQRARRPDMRAPYSRTPNRIVQVLNKLAFELQYFYMKKRITHETVTLHSAYFHPRDLGHDLDAYLGV